MLKIIGILLLIIIGGFVLVNFLTQKPRSPLNVNLANLLPTDNQAIAAGRQLSNNQCQEEGVPYKLSVSPMKMEDFSHIEPYGLMIGGHVTPIDHQYFSPTIFDSPKDAYPVFAMADSKLVNIEPHPTRTRLIFSVTCTFFYYYDLLTSLEPEFSDKHLPIDVKKGQLIGHIGGQTLDFAVWDTTKPLSGFLIPEHYRAESWKIYTADPLDYYTDELRQQILSKYVRTDEPLSGKIDYDIDGKIIGNWFEAGSDGYAGDSTGPTEYWKSHLAFAPFALDPTAYMISVGFLADEGGNAQNQFSVPRSAPPPDTVGVENGLVKYELRGWANLKPDGTKWDHLELIKGPRLNNENSPVIGCALFELLEKRKLKFETFLKQSCESINGFSQNARIYER